MKRGKDVGHVHVKDDLEFGGDCKRGEHVSAFILGNHGAVFETEERSHLLLGESPPPSQIAKAVGVMFLEYAGSPFYSLLVRAIYQVG